METALLTPPSEPVTVLPTGWLSCLDVQHWTLGGRYEGFTHVGDWRGHTGRRHGGFCTSTWAGPTDDTDQAVDINPVVDVEPASPAQERAFEEADEAAKHHYARLLAVRDAQLTSDRAAVENAQAAYRDSAASLATDAVADPAERDTSLNACPDGDCSWAYLTRITHSPQARWYWCGPATGVMVLKGWASPSQLTMSTHMNTWPETGTGWGTGPNAPIPSGINAYVGTRRDYTGIGVPSGGGTSTTRTTFQQRVVANTDAGRGLAANIWQGASTPPNSRLNPGYPAQTVKHIFAIRGYGNYGSTAYYVDPASGGAGVAWGGNVPAYSTVTTTKLMPLLGARGYVW